MSGTTPTPPPGGDSLRSPTFIIACGLLLIVSGTIAAIFWKGSPEVASTIAGSVVSGVIGALTGYYYGASKHPAAVPTQGAS